VKTEKRLDRTVEVALQKLAKAQTRTEHQLERFERATEKRFGILESRVDRLAGSDLERRYRERAPSYFAPLIRRAHVVEGDELVAFLEDAVDRGQITQDERTEWFLADVIVRGKWREDGRDVYLVVEASWVVDGHNVERATRRTRLLAQLGVLSIPVVAGVDITRKATELARYSKVWQVIDGQTTPP
jgi:exoribonuclease II